MHCIQYKCQKAFHVTFSNNIVVKKAPYFCDTQITQIHNIHIICRIRKSDYQLQFFLPMYHRPQYRNIYIYGQYALALLLLYRGTFVSFLSNLGHKSSVLGILLQHIKILSLISEVKDKR